ncbi:MAG: hypothetical protein P4K86_04870 [Terracidiphilus sp.]|nr:hypothetical protein [Terracidiphilus sp.]
MSFSPTSLMVGLSNALAGKADVLYSRGIYTTTQLARLTQFTTDPEGKTAGIKHETFKAAEPQGAPAEAIVEQGMTLAGTTRPEPEEQEVTALRALPSRSVYFAEVTSHRMTGYYQAQSDDDYVMFVQTQRRFKLLVDDKVVDDNTVSLKAILSQLKLHLSKGPHKIELDLMAPERTGGLRFSLLVGVASKNARRSGNNGDRCQV